MKEKIRPYILPCAIVLGIALHRWCAMFSFLVPYIIFSILLLTFAAVDLRHMKFKPLYLWLMLFQVAVSIGGYCVLCMLGADTIVAEGVLVGVLCPVASSVAVISCMLGADRTTVTGYTIVGNLLVAIMAPLYFSFIGLHQDMPFWQSFWNILRRIGPTIGLPFFVALALQMWLPKANDLLSRHTGWGFYLWSLALLFTLGQTIDFIFLHGSGHWDSIVWLCVAALAGCVLQFGCGRWLGHRHGDTVSGGQLLGQKNTAMGIWMANFYLHPLASVFLAFYSIYQNIFNSWQIARYEKSHHQPRPEHDSAAGRQQDNFEQ
jgi:BASS family bile acid:Na+ symporter